MRFVVRHLVLLLALRLAYIDALAGDAPKLVRSLSGPSGKVAGATFVFDIVRSRFVYPQDNSLTIYFEWEAEPGLHVLTGMWKQPDGRVATISPDVKIETATKSLNCYWTFSLTAGLPNGVWTLEVRIDGQPAGSHPFEIAGMEEPRPEATTADPAAPKQPTLDQMFKAVSPSMVWIHKLDAAGRRIDTTSGFVLRANQIATAFQSIDAASRIEIEFAGSRRVTVNEVLDCSRTGDWAILGADTGPASAIPQGNPKSVAVGERLIVFTVEGSARVMGGVDIGGRRIIPNFGERIQFSPAVSADAAGGPLLDNYGRVVGILGGSVTPGARFSGRAMSLSPALWNTFNIQNAATPISEVREPSASPKKFEALLRDGTLTVPVTPMPEFFYGGVTNALPKHASDGLPRDLSDFSTRDTQIWVFALFSRKGKLSKGEVSVNVYDPLNRLRVSGPSKKVSLPEQPERISFSFSPASLTPGFYRVDLNWDGRPVWRTFVRITD
jgi:hypothetical protein